MGLPTLNGPCKPRSNWGGSGAEMADRTCVPSDPGQTFTPQLLRLEVQGHAIDAIAQMRGRRSVLEHVAEMAAAAAAVHFHTHHAETTVARGLDRARNRIVETRPAGAALEFGLGDEQRLIAAGAGETAGPLLIV